MTPSKGDPDHAVKLSGGCAKYVYILCVCVVHLSAYMHVFMYVYVSINRQPYIGVMQSQ